MLTDERISELLELAAESFEVPELGIDRVLAATEPAAPASTKTAWRERFRPRLVLASLGAASVVILLVLAAVSYHGRPATSNSMSGATADIGTPSESSPVQPVPAQKAPSGATGSSGGTTSSAPLNATAAGSADVAQGDSPSAPTVSPRVVQTGSAQLQVRAGQVQPALDKLTALAPALSGLVAASSINADSGPGGSASASATLRVPVAQWAALQSRLPGIGKVVSSSSSAKDVTGEYVDLVARLNALHLQLNTYETILTKATSTGDVLAVQQQIDGVQSQIEQLEGQRQLLANQSDLATLNVTLSEQGAAVTVPPPSNDSGLGGAVHRAWHHFTSGIESVIAASGTFALVLIALTVIAVGGRIGYRLLRRRLV